MDLLILLLLLPVAGALLILFPGTPLAWVRPLAMATAGLTLLYSLVLYTRLDFSSGAMQLYHVYPWNPRLGTSFSFGIDGISWPLVVLTNLLTLLAITVSSYIQERIRTYYLLLLLLETATMGVFLAQGWALFYVFWELVLIPLFFLIDRWGGANRQTAALNFVLYTLGGSIFMLLSLLVLFDATPRDDHFFLFTSMQAAGVSLPVEKQTLIFLGLLIGFGVKMLLFPLHGWLPLVYMEAPSPVNILLSGILLKMGSYGLIRSVATFARCGTVSAKPAGDTGSDWPDLRWPAGLAAK
ncbi:MAG: proton-conducting transporter membrane subunit [Thiolinea sp.]